MRERVQLEYKPSQEKPFSILEVVEFLKNTMKQSSMEQSSVENIEKRKPILDEGSVEQFTSIQMDQQWGLLTEAIRRDILSKPEVRKIAIGYITFPVDESLPNKFLSALSSDERITKLKKRYEDKIGNYLEIEPVPDDQISPDVMHAAPLITPESMVEMFQRVYGVNTPEYYEQLKGYVDSGMFLRGITAQERLMIAQRYRFARDVKLLALQAEVSEHKEDIQANDHGEVKLPSGTIININIEDEIKRRELMNPQSWEKRRQLKDRVYEIQAGSSRYILKEKKTARHVHTKEHGHKPGLTSLEELQIAQHFQDSGIEEQGNIRVNWERPVASVSFPDGFQFAVFEHEDGLLEDDSIKQVLAQEILENRKQFEHEFDVIRAMAEKFKDAPRVLAFEYGSTESGLRAILQWMGLRKRKEQVPELTFEDFAAIKALRMERRARSLMKEIITRNGYANKDLDGYAYKINSKDGNPQLEIFGFDFEYFSRIDPGEIEERIKRDKDFEQEWESGQGVGFLRWYDGRLVTRIQKAGYFAILESEGLLQKDEKY